MKACSVGDAMQQLTEWEQREMQTILDNGVPSHVIAVWFTDKRGIEGITATAVTNHRRGFCGCC
jgi:hypothetical protein